MRIAQVAPLFESVPPKGYGGTERVVSYLTEELVRQGHDVTVFASGDSRTSARLVPICPRALRLDTGCVDHVSHHIRLLERVAREAQDFDVIHYHVDYLHFPLSRRLGVPQFTTLHGRLDLPDLVPLYEEFPEMPVVSISMAQRAPLPHAHWLANVPHGIPRDLYPFQSRPGRYLVFLGRICPEKRPDRAIEIARRAGLPLKIAAKVDPVDRAYFSETIAPLLATPGVEFVGEVDEAGKRVLLGGALALLFPIDWPEPFGLVLIESLACGTPVVAMRGGSVEEIIDHGRTGFIVDGLIEAVDAVKAVGHLERDACRARFEQAFSAERMASDYVALYRAVAAPQAIAPPPAITLAVQPPEAGAQMGANGSREEGHVGLRGLRQ